MNHTVTSNKSYWEDFYRDLALSVPSQFCAMVSTEVKEDVCVVEMGCGNGRDSLYFASQKNTVCAMDLSHEAVKSCNDAASGRGFDHAHFVQGDLSSSEDMENLFAAARERSPSGTVTGYSRFVMHSINDEQEAAYLAALSPLMKSGELVYFEFRSKEDADLEKTFGGHYRRFVDTDRFVADQTQKHGFELKYEITGRGMAKYKSEDPFVSRLIFEKV